MFNIITSEVCSLAVFDEIYRDNKWGFGSGSGSLPSVTEGYRKLIESFIKDNDIKSVVDLGCGDWQFSSLADWGGAKYTGLDVVASVIDQNKAKYGSQNISFQTIAPGDTDLPSADLLIVKDVLQHLADPSVKKFIEEVLPKYRFALITNDITPADKLNSEIAEGKFRPLDLRQPPFSIKATDIFRFHVPRAFGRNGNDWFRASDKLVLLVTNK